MSTTENGGHQGRQCLLTDELLPKSAVLVAAFRGDPNVALSGHPLVRTAEALAAHHHRQWAAEDDSRAATDVDGVAGAKRLIDELNAQRVGLVEQIDRWVAAEATAHPHVSLHTETLGSVIDRLAIAWVRSTRLTAATGDLQPARDALRQLAELAGAYDDLIRDLAAGRRRLPRWRPLKRYGAGR